MTVVQVICVIAAVILVPVGAILVAVAFLKLGEDPTYVELEERLRRVEREIAARRLH